MLAVAKETGKPFGWGEFGSTCISTDPSCDGRAAWVRDTTAGASAPRAPQFVCYWNQSSDVDFTLRDRRLDRRAQGADRELTPHAGEPGPGRTGPGLVAAVGWLRR